MAFEWDPSKAAGNFQKHRVRFSDAVAVFEDELAITVEDEHTGEERYVTIGCDILGRVLTVVYTWRGSDIRIISARKATLQETRVYHND